MLGRPWWPSARACDCPVRRYNPAIVPRSARYFDALSASVVLTAALVVPLYFVVFTERVFEPEKAALLGCLGLVAALALAARWWSGRAQTHATRRPPPLVLAALALWLVELLSTLQSVAPWTSLFGGYQRGQGLLTASALLALFLAARRLGRTAEGPLRLSTILGASVLPAALYGILQRWGLDPLPWLGDNVVRVSGTAGNSVMLAAWLVLVLPFTGAATVAAWRTAAARGGAGAVWRLAAWLVTVALGLLALLLTASRGPLLALALGAGIALLAHAARQGRRRLAVLVLGSALVLGLGVAALNLREGPLAAWRNLPVLDRLASALDPENSTTRVRLRLWEGSAAAIAGRPERLLLGNGPETMPLVWAPYYPPILAYDEARGTLPDRAHNLTFDTLLTTGAVGLLALLGFLALAIDAALGALGLLATPAQRRRLWATVLTGGLVMVALASALGGPRLAGPGLGFGLLAGLTGWLVARAWRAGPAEDLPLSTGPAGADGGLPPLLALAALAALTAHLAEVQVGFPVVSTRLVVWLVAGLLASVVDRRAAARDDARIALVSDPGGPASWDGAFAALAVAITLLFDFARFGLVASGPVGVAVLVGASALGLGSTVGTAGTWSRRRVLGLGLAGAAFAGGQMLLLVAGTRDLADAVPAAAATLAWYVAVLMGLLLAWAGRSAGLSLTRSSALAGTALWAGLALASVILMLPSVGDAAYKEGRIGWQSAVQGLREQGEQGRALSFLDRAGERYALAQGLAPWEPAYALAAGREAVERADLLDEGLSRALEAAGRDRLADEYEPAFGAVADRAARRDRAFVTGLAAIDRAAQLMPGSPEPLVTRGLALRLWGDRTRAAELRAERLSDALAQFDDAALCAPGWPEVLDEAGVTAFLAGDSAGALDRARRALALDPFFRRAWRTVALAQMELGDLAAAADAYAEYFVDFRNAGDVTAQRGQLALLTRLGRDAAALAVARTLAELAPDDARAWADLAVLQARSGDAAAARVSARRAAGLAPQDLGIAALVRRLDTGQGP